MFLSTFGAQGQKFSTEIERITHAAVQSIDAKGLTFVKSMAQNSEEITALINDASAKATASIGRTVGDLDTTARVAIEQSQQTSSAAVTEMLETHGMLRNDTSALFERLREANVLLQEVLGGATENLGTIETHAVARASPNSSTTMNDIGERSGGDQHAFEGQISRSRPARRRCCATSRAPPRSSTMQGGRSAPPPSRSTRATAAPRRCSPTAARRSNSWSTRSTARSAISTSGSSASRRCCPRRSRPPRAAPATSRACSPKPRPKAPRRSPTSTNWCARPPRRSASAPRKPCTRSTSRRPARPRRCSARPASASSRSCAR